MAFILDAQFWNTELSCSLLIKNNGFITRKNAETRVQEAMKLINLIPEGFKSRYYDLCGIDAGFVEHPEYSRIFKADSVRTFSSKYYCDLIEKRYARIYELIKDYHQGLGCILSFLSLFLDAKNSIFVTLFLHNHCCNGFYKFENNEYLLCCKTFDKLLHIKDPVLSNHLASYCFSGMYLSKHWIAMTVHVFPFRNIFDWVCYLVKYPQKTTLMCFGLALMKTLRKKLLNMKNTNEILLLLRFEREFYADDYKLEGSNITVYEEINNNCVLYELDYREVARIYEEICLAEEILNKNKIVDQQYTDDEIYFSDSGLDESSESDN